MTSDSFKVDFFCVGVAKAGTTTLHDLLSLQEGVCLPRRKETNYFSFGCLGSPTFTGPLDNSSVNEPTITSFDDYKKDFNFQAGDVIGEICPEPVSRSYSNYQHLVRDGREYAEFEEALADEADRLDKGWEWFWGLKRNSFYFETVKEYIETFGEQNVKILLFDEFIKNQELYLKEVMDFVGMDSSKAVFEEFDSNKSGVVSGKWKYIHKLLLSEGFLNSALRVILPEGLRKKLGGLFKRFSTVKGGVSPETKTQLLEEFSADLHRLNDLIDGRVGVWLEKRDVS